MNKPTSQRFVDQYRKTGDLETLAKRCWNKADRVLELSNDSETPYILFNFSDNTFVEIDMLNEERFAVRYFGSLDAYNEHVDGIEARDLH